MGNTGLNRATNSKMGNKTTPHTETEILSATQHFIVSPYKSRPKTPWKVELKAAFSGRRIKRFCATEAEAWTRGRELVEAFRKKGEAGLEKSGAMSMASAAKAWQARSFGMSESHTRKVDKLCELLKKRFSHVDVEPQELETWMRTLPGKSQTTSAMWHRYVKAFFNYCFRMHWVARDPSTVLETPKAAVGRAILSPAQMRQLLKAEMEPWMRVCLLLGGFAGLRTEEMARMNWEDIDTKTGQIHIRPGVMKDSGGFDQRIVDFTPPLKRRKRLFPKKLKGKLMPVEVSVFQRYRRELVKGLGWAGWPDNCLRHSFATYHLAQSKNASSTAFQMGHTSPGMVLRVYAVPSKKADARAWWAL